MDKQAVIFIFITNICNLKCLGCMQSCDRKNENPYFVNIEELKEQLLHLQNKVLTINNRNPKSFNLTGGEPLLHPQFFEICRLIRQLFPDFYINVCSNGLLLNKLSDNELIELAQLNIKFQISYYPDLKLLNYYDIINKRINNLNISLLGEGAGGSHFYFTKQDNSTSKIKKFKNYDRSCELELKNQDFVTIFKNKIYSCQKDINYLQRETNFFDDATNIFNIQDGEELIQNKKHSFCNFCEKLNNSGYGQEYILWTHHYKNADLVYNNNLKDLYINHYNIYYNLQHTYNKDYRKILQNDIFQKYLPDDQKRFANTRYLNGKGDILIPVEKEIPLQKIKDSLLNKEDIINYNLYFIFIGNNYTFEEELYNSFVPFDISSPLNNYLLKASNLTNAYKIFYISSYLNNKFILKNFEIKKI